MGLVHRAHDAQRVVIGLVAGGATIDLTTIHAGRRALEGQRVAIGLRAVAGGIAPVGYVHLARAFEGQLVVIRHAAGVYIGVGSGFGGIAASSNPVVAGHGDSLGFLVVAAWAGFDAEAVAADVPIITIDGEGCAACVRPRLRREAGGKQRGDGE